MARPEPQAKTQVCPACGEGELHPRVEHTEAEYKGHTENLPLHFSICDECGSELAGAEELRKNKRAMVAFRKRLDGLLSGTQIKSFRRKYFLKQETLSNLAGGGKVGFSRYENDDVAQSEPMDSLLRLLIAAPVNLMLLASMKGVALRERTQHRISESGADAIRFLLPELPKIKDALDWSIKEQGQIVQSQMSIGGVPIWGSGPLSEIRAIEGGRFATRFQKYTKSEAA